MFSIKSIEAVSALIDMNHGLLTPLIHPIVHSLVP
jgi:hypothetical protein